MNIKTKTIIASTFLTALSAGTPAIAGDNDHFAASDYASTTDTVLNERVNYVIDEIESVKIDETFISGRKGIEDEILLRGSK